MTDTRVSPFGLNRVFQHFVLWKPLLHLFQAPLKHSLGYIVYFKLQRDVPRRKPPASREGFLVLVLCFVDLRQSLARLAVVSCAPNSGGRNSEADQFPLYSLIVAKSFVFLLKQFYMK